MRFKLERRAFLVGAAFGAAVRLTAFTVQLVAPYAVMSTVLGVALLGLSGLCWRYLRSAVPTTPETWSASDALRIVRANPSPKLSAIGWSALVLVSAALLLFGFWTGFMLVHVAMGR
jgi:hypothetical protein